MDLWLGSGSEVDTLGVASTLDVEDSFVGPNVLVVSNELSQRVSREGSLSSSGETEEESNIPVDSLVGGGVKRKLSEFDGLEVVLMSIVSRVSISADTATSHMSRR